jgi:hypothetical protein
MRIAVCLRTAVVEIDGFKGVCGWSALEFYRTPGKTMYDSINNLTSVRGWGCFTLEQATLRLVG